MIVASLVLCLGTLLGAGVPPAAQNAAPLKISSVVMRTKLIHADAPKYPKEAQKKNIQGIVTLDIVIGPKGDVESAKAIDGPKELQKAALACVKTWRYQPTELKGQQRLTLAEYHSQMAAEEHVREVEQTLLDQGREGLDAEMNLVAAMPYETDEPRTAMTRFLAEAVATSHWFNIAAARRDLGYQPQVSTAEGLQRLEQWLKKSALKGVDQ